MSRTATCPDVQELEDFAIGQIPDADAEHLEEHLAHCGTCVATMHTLHGHDTLIEAMRAQRDGQAGPPRTDAVETLIEQFKSKRIGLSPDELDAEIAECTQEWYSFLAPPEQAGGLGQFGPYRLLRVLGRGGMGVVFEAEDIQLHRPVALKALRPGLAADPSARLRFLREAQATASIQHDHIMTIHHVGEDHGVPFLAMPLLHGETLEDRLQREGPQPLSEIVRIGCEIAEGLAAAHARGLIHRDVKPANIWLEMKSELRTPNSETNPRFERSNHKHGDARAASIRNSDLDITSDLKFRISDFRVKILDFGLARTVADDARLTGVGVIAGTPAYMAPEQALGEAVDPRSDLFSLGSVLYALCTGQPPFRAGTSVAVLRLVSEETPQPVHEVNPQIPNALGRIIEKLHAKDPTQRFQFAEQAAVALRECMLPSTTTSRTSGPGQRSGKTWQHWLTAAAVLLVGIAGFGMTEATGITRILQLGSAPQAASGPSADTGTSAAQQSGDGNREPIQLAAADAAAEDDKAPSVFPTALLTFEERGSGAKDYGPKVTDVLFALLSAKPELFLVDRNDIKKVLSEQELNLSGAVKPAEATRVGQLTGAKLLVTGSVIHVDKSLYLVAKIIGTETSIVVGASVNGKISDELGPLVEKLADAVANTIAERADKLVAPPVRRTDRVAALNQKLRKAARPVVLVKIVERHVGRATIDPAAQTEFMLLCKDTGFTVLDPEEAARSRADVVITGEGMSEFATRHGNLVSVKARLEVKAVDRKTDRVLAVDRQTSVVVDLTEQIAGKSALQEAAVVLAERMLPKLVKE